MRARSSAPSRARGPRQRSQSDDAGRIRRGSCPPTATGPTTWPAPTRWRARHDLADAVGELDPGSRMRLEVEPPRRFRFAPAVHRERHQVRTVLEVAQDHRRSRPLRRPIVVTRMAPQRWARAGHRPRRPPVTLKSARWTFHASRMNHRGGSRGRLSPSSVNGPNGPGRTRTCDPLLRRQPLCPAGLRGLASQAYGALEWRR